MSENTEKIRDRLNNALAHLRLTICVDDAIIDHKAQVKDDINDALALLAEKPSTMPTGAKSSAEPYYTTDEPIRLGMGFQEPKCKTCGGTGQIPEPLQDEPFRFIPCPNCKPAVDKPKCKTCWYDGCGKDFKNCPLIQIEKNSRF
jgi:hypothetical protein